MLKKNDKANLEKKRYIFFQIGLIVAISIVLLVLETGEEKTKSVHTKEYVEIQIENKTINKNERIKYPINRQAEFPGGEKGLELFISKNLKNQEKQMPGIVYIGFKISTEGKISKGKVIKHLTPESDIIALNILSSMPDWSPAVESGNKISSEIILPVVFL